MKKYALCIGNDEYTILGKLNCAVNDATSIESTLKNLGFDTELYTNLDRDALISAIVNALDKMKDYDAFIIYYAGHGFEVGGDNILAPIDLSVEADERTIKYYAFPLEDILKSMEKYPSVTKVIILDACREIAGYRGDSTNFAPISAPQGTIVAFATSPGQKSKENSLIGHGYYTEALLKYMPLPRVSIETTFKKVREYLFAKTNGTQIPWEHTSLVGDFYLNPDTIYDGNTYSAEALADSDFSCMPNSPLKEIIDGLKGHHWEKQQIAIGLLSRIDFNEASANELFVLGRNIYQAADGNSFAAMRFIDNFEINAKIPQVAKTHILVGIAYEIYFDSTNALRSVFKTGYYGPVINYLEKEAFSTCKEFIASKLTKIEEKLIYLPGQNENIELILDIRKEQEEYYLCDIVYQGKSVLYNSDGTEKIDITGFGRDIEYSDLKTMISEIIVSPVEMVRFTLKNELDVNNFPVSIPYDGFSLRFTPHEIAHEDEFEIFI